MIGLQNKNHATLSANQMQNQTQLRLLHAHFPRAWRQINVFAPF